MNPRTFRHLLALMGEADVESTRPPIIHGTLLEAWKYRGRLLSDISKIEVNKAHYEHALRPNAPCTFCEGKNVIALDARYEYAKCPDCGATSDPDESLPE